MVAIPTRSGRLKRLLTKPWLYDILSAPLGIVGGGAAAYKFFADSQPVRGWLSIGVAALSALVLCGKAGMQALTAKKEESLHELEGCLETLHAILLQGSKEANADPDLRLTVHVPLEGGHELEQVIDYVGKRSWQNTAGRIFPGASGVIGKAFREGEAKVWERQNDNYEAYVDELIKDWSYDPVKAREIDKSRVGGMAIPITDESDNVLGILYMDVLERNFFTDDRRADSIFATSGIANFVCRRYKKLSSARSTR